jgi:hypothetical protein
MGCVTPVAGSDLIWAVDIFAVSTGGNAWYNVIDFKDCKNRYAELGITDGGYGESSSRQLEHTRGTTGSGECDRRVEAPGIGGGDTGSVYLSAREYAR